MNEVKITPKQFISVIVLFELGSAIALSIGSDAKKDAWIVILIAFCLGILLNLVYYYIFKNNKFDSFTNIVHLLVGNILGRIFCIFYICYFMYIGGRVLRDFSDLITINTLPQTPLFAICIYMGIAIAYGNLHGTEVISRAGSVFLHLVIASIIFVYFLILLGRHINFYNLLPVLDNGWRPILKAVFPTMLTFPFGETITFIVFYHDVTENKKLFKTIIGALSLSTFILTLNIVLNIAVLGDSIYGKTFFPLLKTVSNIELGNFIRRLDIFVVFLLIICGYFKITLFTNAATRIYVDVFKVKNYKKTAIILPILVSIFAITMSDNLVNHLYIGLEIVPTYIHPLFQICFPLILAIITFIDKRSNRKK